MIPITFSFHTFDVPVDFVNDENPEYEYKVEDCNFEWDLVAMVGTVQDKAGFHTNTIDIRAMNLSWAEQKFVADGEEPPEAVYLFESCTVAGGWRFNIENEHRANERLACFPRHVSVDRSAKIAHITF